MSRSRSRIRRALLAAPAAIAPSMPAPFAGLPGPFCNLPYGAYAIPPVTAAISAFVAEDGLSAWRVMTQAARAKLVGFRADPEAFGSCEHRERAWFEGVPSALSFEILGRSPAEFVFGDVITVRFLQKVERASFVLLLGES
jgi:hypothetical protein